MIKYLILFMFSLSLANQILVIKPQGETFDLAYQGILSEMDSTSIQVLNTHASISQEAILSTITQAKPDAIILMDNANLQNLIELSKTNQVVHDIPKFSILTLNLKNEIQGLQNFYGVEVEVPAYILFTQMRKLSQSPLTKIGVFYQKKLSQRVKKSIAHLKREQIEIVSHCVDCEVESPNESTALTQMKQGLRKMVFEEKVQALWMLADNSTVNKLTIKEFWIRAVSKTDIAVATPFIDYTTPNFPLGHFAAQANNFELGVQIANQIENFMEEGGLENPTEPPISVRTSVNLTKLKQISWKLREQQLENIKHIFE